MTYFKFSFIILDMLKKNIKPHVGKLSLILLGVIALLIASDLLTKYFEEQYHWSFTVIPSFILISGMQRNPGCAFGFLNQHPEIGQPILITVTFIMLAVVIFMFIVLPERFVLLKIASALVIAGAIGNLVDRLWLREVRDWFGIRMFGSMTYCNFADFFIVLGAILAIIDLMFLNEWAVFPLTKKAKEVQAARRKAEEAEEAAKKGAKADCADSVVGVAAETAPSAENTEIADTGTDFSAESGEETRDKEDEN